MLVWLALPAIAWSNGSCAFGGYNWISGSSGYAKTYEFDFSCAGVQAKVKYKVDGYWYSTGPATGGAWVVQQTPPVNPSDTTGAHRGKDPDGSWGGWRYSY